MVFPVDPTVLTGLVSGLGGGRTESNSQANNSLAVTTSANVGVSPLIAIATGGKLSDLSAGDLSASATGAPATTSGGSLGGSGSDPFGFLPAGASDPGFNDIDAFDAGGAGIVDNLLADPVMLIALAAGGFFLLREID